MLWSETEKQRLAGMWAAARPQRLATAKARMLKLSKNKSHYVAVQKRTGVPWWFIMCLHEREACGDMRAYLGNGEPFTQVTNLVPAGRGPFKTFEDGAVDALVHEGFHKITDWSIPRVLFCAEAFNGFGYRGKGIPSPYVWAGTSQYTSGKYVRDGVFSGSSVDQQLGVAIMLQALINLGLLAVSGAAKSNSGAGTTVSHTTTSTNFITVIIGAAMTVLGAQSFGTDAIHVLAILGGPIAMLSGFLNQLHITGGSNSNTIDQIMALAQQIADMAAAREAASKPTPETKPVAPLETNPVAAIAGAVAGI